MTITNTLSSDRVFFCSDLHYNHANVLRLSHRNFETMDKMNKHIIETLKITLKPGDKVFDLGDTFWKITPTETKEFFDACPGVEWYKVMGNHDKENLHYGENNAFLKDYYKLISDRLDLSIGYNGETCQVVLSHFPELDWNHRYRGGLMIHGHCHGSIDSINSESGELRVDVGFDGELAKSYGSFLIPFSAIFDHFKNITGENVWFHDYAIKKLKEL